MVGADTLIPKKIHFIWVGGELPDWAITNIDEFRRLNPNYEIRIHGEEVLLDRYRDVYGQLDEVCAKSDLLRYSVLRSEGGWYFDADFYPFRPLADMERAFALDGRQMFITEQHGQLGAHLTYANGILGAAPDHPVFDLIDEYIDQTEPFGRCTYGPIMMLKLVAEHPNLFAIGGWPFFFPAGINRAARIWRACSQSSSRYAVRLAPTAGQLPFMMHLWAGGKTGLRERDDMMDFLPGERPAIYAGLRACVGVLPIQWDDPTQPFRAVAEGLAHIGFDVEIRQIDGPLEGLFDTCDLFVCWNGRKWWYEKATAKARETGLPMLMMEHGFWDRRAYTQIDHVGILHWASWVGGLSRPAPREGAERLRQFYPDGIKQTARRRKGHVLVIGQVQGDSQMDDSEVDSATALSRMVARTMPDYPGELACFRPHPNARVVRKEYLPRCEAETLEDAVAGARFAVMINSNSGNECLALGCPVLTLGPSVYGAAGVAHTTSGGTFAKDFAEMMEGWTPDNDSVENYLEWLACRQWSQNEIRSGKALRMLVGRAMT